MNPHFTSEAQSSLEFWKNDPFYAPDTVVLGLDIGIEGIGITVRRGQEWLYSKTLLVDLPEAEALATRRAFRASRHARKNRKTRMRRLKELFAKHGLPWVDDDIMSRSDPFKLRHRAITGILASKEALSICIRSCVLRRGYDYFALTDDESEISGEMPWGADSSLSEAKKWLSSNYVDTQLRDLLLSLTPLLTHNKKELKEDQIQDWQNCVEQRFLTAEKEGIPATLQAYVENKLSERKARGRNYPRNHVEEHLRCIILRHQHLIDSPEEFTNALFRPNLTWHDKQTSIFHYNRKTPTEAKRHFAKKVKECPYCSWLEIPAERCGTAGDQNIRKWKLIDFVSCRTFEWQALNKIPIGRTTLPAEAVKYLLSAIEENVKTWKDVKKSLETIFKQNGLKLTSGGWNKTQLEQLKDIVTPSVATRQGRANMSVSAAKLMVAAATNNDSNYEPHSLEQWKKDSGLYTCRAEIDANGGIYPQVQTLLGTLRKKKSGEPVSFATEGFLHRLFKKLAQEHGINTTPDYCVIECIKNAATTKKQKDEITKEIADNKKKRQKWAEDFGKSNATRAEFLRMRLFCEQGGSPKSPAICPFTGQELHVADLFTAKLQLAHIYPDSKGGLYIAENLVLTTQEVNLAMADRTPKQAAAAGLPGWLSWNAMIKQSAKFHWGKMKKELFAHDMEKDAFPDFGNTTRTAQLAAELRNLAAVWMGINHDAELLRTRIGNPAGIYTAAARRGMLWPEYSKNRSDNNHHRWDAAVMTCIPPTGINDVRYRGIFHSILNEKKNRTLISLQGLPTPDFNELRHDGGECPIENINSRSKYKPLGDSTFWGVDKNGITHQRIPLDPSEIKAKELFDTLCNMGIPTDQIPGQNKLERWLTDCQATTKDDTIVIKPLKLNNGTPIRNIWKFSRKGNLDKSPIGWNGIITDSEKFHQLRSLTSSNDRLELWLGWNSKKKCWAYYKRLIPTKAALDGFKRMGLPWRGCKGAPKYLLDILQKNKSRDLREMICGTLPPFAIKVATFRKGDVFLLDFELNQKYIDKLLEKEENIDMLEHPHKLPTWGKIKAIGSAPYIEFRSLTHKDRKTKVMTQADEYAKLKGLEAAAKEAAHRKLTPPA